MVGGYREWYFLVLNLFMASEKPGSPWKHAYLNLLFVGALILEYLSISISDLEHHLIGVNTLITAVFFTFSELM